MTVVETILVYVVVPLAIVAVLALLTLVPGRHKRPRYRPGQAWEHAPVWYEPHPGATGVGGGHGDAHGDGHAALGAGPTRAALTSGAPAAAPAVGGPRGGARGTW